MSLLARMGESLAIHSSITKTGPQEPGQLGAPVEGIWGEILCETLRLASLVDGSGLFGLGYWHQIGRLKWNGERGLSASLAETRGVYMSHGKVCINEMVTLSA
jgi:hypothetical protein